MLTLKLVRHSAPCSLRKLKTEIGLRESTLPFGRVTLQTIDWHRDAIGAPVFVHSAEWN